VPGEASPRSFDGRVVRAARTSVVVASLLAGMKLLAALFTGSVAVAGSFVDSLMDVFASSVNLLAVRIGARPADEDHRYGHGKAESLAGMFQGSVVGFSGVYLVVESVRRLVTGAVVEREGIVIATMAVSMVASAWITWFLRKSARTTGSVALRADSVHFATDVATNVGILGAMLAMRATGARWIDPVVGLAVAAVVLRSSWGVVRASLDELMDRELGGGAEDAVRQAIARLVPEAREVRELKTRRAGRLRFVDLTVAFDRTLPFAEAHRLSERVRAAAREAVPGAQVQVHADPDPVLPGDHPVSARAL
jgi:ferrous-iron efflux pump FieF